MSQRPTPSFLRRRVTPAPAPAQMRYRITRNIGHAFVRLGKYTDAMNMYAEVMQHAPDFQTGFNLVVCNYGLGGRENMKKAFTKLVQARLVVRCSASLLSLLCRGLWGGVFAAPSSACGCSLSGERCGRQVCLFFPGGGALDCGRLRLDPALCPATVAQVQPAEEEGADDDEGLGQDALKARRRRSAPQASRPPPGLPSPDGPYGIAARTYVLQVRRATLRRRSSAGEGMPRSTQS